MGRTLAQMAADVAARRAATPLGQPGVPIGVGVAAVASRPGMQPNAQPLGGLTGAPPQTTIRTVQVIPYTSTGNGGGNPRTEASIIAQAVRSNRTVVMTAPLVGFGVFVGPSSTSPDRGLQLPAGLPYEFLLPGGQDLYAVTDAPVYLALQVQIAALLVGDEERKPE